MTAVKSGETEGRVRQDIHQSHQDVVTSVENIRVYAIDPFTQGNRGLHLLIIGK